MVFRQSPLKAIVLSEEVPEKWQRGNFTPQQVALRGILLSFTRESDVNEVLLLTNRFRWYPTAGVPSGQLLLAQHGMDAALWDEVVQRAPFVSPEVSRESEAFYESLQSVGQVPLEELLHHSRENVQRQLSLWSSYKEKWEAQLKELQQSSNSAEESQQNDQKEMEQVRNRIAMARSVEEAGKRGLSAVAPMFLQPEAHCGELVLIEGIARRAVRIAKNSATSANKLEGDYFELEVFTKDSQNLPLVCCVSRLPDGFPTGDKIREPVRLAGVFFKSWRYRTRQLDDTQGVTDRQKHLYTPVIVGSVPIWLRVEAESHNLWGLWGGLAFLGLLTVLWIVLSRNSRQRRIRHAKRESLDFENL